MSICDIQDWPPRTAIEWWLPQQDCFLTYLITYGYGWHTTWYDFIFSLWKWCFYPISDLVNLLKTRVENWESPSHPPTSPTRSSPHVPASLLKLWYRELHEPLVPLNKYDQAILQFNKWALLFLETIFNALVSLSHARSFPKYKKLLYWWGIKAVATESK